MSIQEVSERFVPDPLRDAASAAFAAALLKVAGPTSAAHSRGDLIQSARTLAADAELRPAGRELLGRLLTVVGDETASADRVRRGVIATYRALAGATS